MLGQVGVSQDLRQRGAGLATCSSQQRTRRMSTQVPITPHILVGIHSDEQFPFEQQT